MHMNLKLLLLPAVLAIAIPQTAQAHRSGCHTLHTCSSDTGSYVCGDLGYPCSGANTESSIPPQSINVPLLVSQLFTQAFNRNITPAESTLWKKRYRTDKNSLTKIRRAMRWHAAQENTSSLNTTSKATEIKPPNLVPQINSLFRSVYSGRQPTPSENTYWISRTKDKSYAAALIGAMAWHRDHNIQH